jgi:hypothetical protein
VHDLAAACRCVLSEAHIRANVNRGPRRLAVQEQSNGRTRRFSGTDDDAARLLRLYRPQHAGYARWSDSIHIPADWCYSVIGAPAGSRGEADSSLI